LGQEKEKCNKIIMNKRQIIASLNNIANTLDNSGLYKEANSITNIMKRLAAFESVDFSDLQDKFKQEDTAPLPEQINKLIKDKNLFELESGYSVQFVLSKMVEYFGAQDKEDWKTELLKDFGSDNRKINLRILRSIDEIEYFQLRDNLSDEEMIQGIEDYYDQFVRMGPKK
jgi:hypothetical protein